LTIETAATDSKLIREALETARRAHAGQTRNGSGGMPYVRHPVAVAELLAEDGFGEATLAAALLHDVVEDSDATVDEIEGIFGRDVSRLVAAMTDQASIEPYQRRKAEHRRRVEEAGGEALAIYAADKFSNARTLRRTYADQGEAVAAEFNVPLEAKEEVWRDDLEMLRRAAPELSFLDEFEAELEALRAARSRTLTPPGRPSRS
jgi:(p)ppGpp synthase/HD superfamily hydrolase